MKKLIMFFCCVSVALCPLCEAHGAIEIKKAAPATEQKQASSGLMAGNSLVPTALGLVGNVMALSQQQKALTKECEPTDAEVAFVKNLMQEWARAGGAQPEFVNRAPCDSGNNYANSVRYTSEGIQPCFNLFNGSQDAGQIYANYPYPGKGYRLKDSAGENSEKNRAIMSDMYEMFSFIDFEDSDYLPSEVSQIARLKEKAVNCAPEKLTAKQRELWGKMLVQTVGGLGQNQNAGTTMSQVGYIMQSGGASPLGTLGGTMNVLTGSLLSQ